MVSCSRERSLFPYLSANPRITPKMTMTDAISQRERRSFSITSLPKYPRITIGIVPKIMSQPMRARGLSSAAISFRRMACWNQARTIAAMSLRKKISTANSVPICVIAVKRAPGSFAPSKNSPTIRMWALDEIGKNSVRP